jgi:hypothetical protein
MWHALGRTVQAARVFPLADAVVVFRLVDYSMRGGTQAQDITGTKPRLPLAETLLISLNEAVSTFVKLARRLSYICLHPHNPGAR